MSINYIPVRLLATSFPARGGERGGGADSALRRSEDLTIGVQKFKLRSICLKLKSVKKREIVGKGVQNIHFSTASLVLLSPWACCSMFAKLVHAGK